MAFPSEIIELLKAKGADLVGFADITVVPAQKRHNLSRAVVFGVALNPHIVQTIVNGPTREYYAEYERVNSLLGELSVSAADFIRSRGLSAVSSAATNEGIDGKTNSTGLPHKTVGTLAGIGWIGKCALLVTEQFGSALRLNRVLTDAPLPTGRPIKASRCGSCRLCVDACPGNAATGDNWERDKHRDSFFDAVACRRTARDIALQRTGILDTFCGICIAVCPWTKKYIDAKSRN